MREEGAAAFYCTESTEVRFEDFIEDLEIDGRYTVYAQVIEGLDVVDRIRVGDTIKKATLKIRAPKK